MKKVKLTSKQLLILNTCLLTRFNRLNRALTRDEQIVLNKIQNKITKHYPFDEFNS